MGGQERVGRHPRLQTPAVAALCRVLPVHAVLCRLRGRSHPRARRRARNAARPQATRPLPPVCTVGGRSRSSSRVEVRSLMERRLILAVFLCFIVLYGYQALFVKPTPPRPKQAGQVQKAAPIPAAQPSQAGGAVTPTAPATVSPVPAAAATPVATLVSEPAERRITIETAVVRAVFDNRGGELTSWRLKRYLDSEKKPVELVATDQLGRQPRPFTLRTDDPAVNDRLDNALFRVSEGAATVDATRKAVRLVFDYQDASGLRATKTYVIEPNSYVVQFNADVTQGDRALNPSMVWGPGLGDPAAAGESSRYLQKAEGIWDDQAGMRRIAPTQMAGEACTGQVVA